MNDYQRLVLSDQSDTTRYSSIRCQFWLFMQFIISAWGLIGQAYFALQLPSGQTERKALAMWLCMRLRELCSVIYLWNFMYSVCRDMP